MVRPEHQCYYATSPLHGEGRGFESLTAHDAPQLSVRLLMACPRRGVRVRHACIAGRVTMPSGAGGRLHNDDADGGRRCRVPALGRSRHWPPQICQTLGFYETVLQLHVENFARIILLCNAWSAQEIFIIFGSRQRLEFILWPHSPHASRPSPSRENALERGRQNGLIRRPPVSAVASPRVGFPRRKFSIFEDLSRLA